MKFPGWVCMGPAKHPRGDMSTLGQEMYQLLNAQRTVSAWDDLSWMVRFAWSESARAILKSKIYWKAPMSHAQLAYEIYVTWAGGCTWDKASDDEQIRWDGIAWWVLVAAFDGRTDV